MPIRQFMNRMDAAEVKHGRSNTVAGHPVWHTPPYMACKTDTPAMGPRMSIGGAKRQNSAKGAIKSASSQNAERHLYCRCGLQFSGQHTACMGWHLQDVLPQAATCQLYFSCTNPDGFAATMVIPTKTP
jgi:hypothetical protein